MKPRSFVDALLYLAVSASFWAIYFVWSGLTWALCISFGLAALLLLTIAVGLRR
jgi:hypothetical protein